ncbi:hypothetical protein [Streptomyces fradiae]|uniref:hypothetical protein n=1 Tax=Streptomyces fradiae TaxID=1906 RepID=UPI002943E072|nr:hypothetical protein [Streptomyces fradiae]WOI58990.1 hypothetical protein RYQ63_03095 [Streptomyces fradiae]
MAQTDTLRPRRTARLVAAGYVGAVAAAALAYGVAGAPEGWSAPLLLATFPGAVLAAFLGYYLLPALLGAGGADGADVADESVGALDFLPQYAGGAILNVLLVWGIAAFVRHFVREARGSRERRG